MKNNLRQIELVLYRLKREYGLPVTVRVPLTNDSDIQTGKITRTYTNYPVKRCICMPANIGGEFIRLLALDKNFRYGGLFDKTIKNFIIDKKDLLVDLTLDCQVIVGTSKYDFLTIDETESGTSYMIKAKKIDGTPVILGP